ncbi:hypothetical protein KJ780_04375, partial [Candidatus Micrarchaeota archaeon]|nr:hypothetical protein [Candidatus Micrarchaeota archaeon]
MKRIIAILCLFMLVPTVSALSASEAKQEWYEAKENSKEAQSEYRDSKLVWATDKTPENEARLISDGKDSLNAALDEAEAWLVWTNLSVYENPFIPDDLKDTVSMDVGTNMDKTPALREEVEEASTQLELGIVFLKMVGKYTELLADVARDTG